MVDPFKVTIAAPYAKMYNTAPTIEVTVDREVVDAVILKPGQKVLIKFEEPLDFESNKVRYIPKTFYVGGSLDTKYAPMVLLYPNERSITNSTKVQELSVKIVIPITTKAQ